jgi:Terminase RNaseH-like domain
LQQTFTDRPNVDNAGKRFFIGVDLGQAQDYTAIVILESERVDSGEKRAWGDPIYHDELRVIHAERFRGVLYPDVAEKVRRLKAEEKLRSSTYHRHNSVWTESYPTVVVDRTGVGPAVTDLLKKSGVSHVGVTITAGNRERGTNVPKRNLVSALQVAFSTGRLKIAKGLELAQVLKEELLNFKLKINVATGHDSYEAWREGEHDDLVLAAALAVWAADRWSKMAVYAR